MKKLPKFRIVKSNDSYYIYLMHGLRIVNYFGKIVENCTTNSGGRYTYMLLKFDRLAKLRLTKGVTFVSTLTNNKIFNIKEKEWFNTFQKAIMLSTSVEKRNRRLISKTKVKLKIS